MSVAEVDWRDEINNIGAEARQSGSKRRNGDKPAPVDLLAKLRTGAWLDAQHFDPLAYHVQGLIPEGSSLLVGPPKAGKSWFVLSVALAVAEGGMALGSIPVEPRPVLYLALEDGNRRLQDRCRALLEGAPIPGAMEYLTSVEPGTAIATIEQWMARYQGAAPLVILDTLGKVMPPAIVGESGYQRDYRVGSALKALVDNNPGSALLTNHHDRKAMSEDFVDAVSGTHGLAGAADTIIVLSRARHETVGVLKVTGRDVVEGEYAMQFRANGGWALDGRNLEAAAAKAGEARAASGLGDRSSEIVAFVASRGLAGARAVDVEAKFGDNARRTLARLVEGGRLAKPTRGLYIVPPTHSDHIFEDGT